MAIEEGQPAPPFELRDARGEQVSLEQLRGREVVVYFYPRDDTPGCTKEAIGFRDLAPELARLGVVVLGVSPDDAAAHTRFCTRYGLPFPLLSDPDRSVMTAYGAWGQKVLYGIKRTGVIRSTVWIGPDGRVRKHWPRVRDAGAHPQQVVEAVRAGVGAPPAD